jgi:hypothetical protein
MAGKDSMPPQDTLVRAAQEIAKARKAVTTAERYIGEASVELPSGCSPKQLASGLKQLRELLMREANRRSSFVPGRTFPSGQSR